MRDFPPVIDTFYARGGGEPSAAPDTRTRARFLLWMLKLQWPVILTTTALGMFWQLPPMFGPFIFGRAVDQGIVPGDAHATLQWAALLLAVTLIGAVFGILMHTYIVRTWLIALYGTMKMVTRKAAQMGHVLPRRTPTGEVLSVASADSDEFGALTEILARTCTQLVAYLVVAFIVLSTSVELGVLLLIAAPVLVGAAFPLLKPLHRRQEIERGRNSDLTSLATDIVAGPADPARHRRRAHLRQQLRRPVPARPSGRPVRRHLAGGHRGRRRAVLGRVRGAARVAGHPPGDRAAS